MAPSAAGDHIQYERRDDLRDELDADIFGTRPPICCPQKYRMPERELRPDVAHALVRDELFLDGNSRQNLATFCRPGSTPRSIS